MAEPIASRVTNRARQQNEHTRTDAARPIKHFARGITAERTKATHPLDLGISQRRENLIEAQVAIRGLLFLLDIGTTCAGLVPGGPARQRTVTNHGEPLNRELEPG